MENFLIKVLDLIAPPFSKWFIRKFKKTKPIDILKRREKIKKEFYKHIKNKNKYGVRSEIIIRDIDRMEEYPDYDYKKKEISPYFKIELKDIYHKGIEAFISPPEYVKKNKYSKNQHQANNCCGYNGQPIETRVPYSTNHFSNFL